jgi:uncharacterized delta-60 repeat protein
MSPRAFVAVSVVVLAYLGLSTSASGSQLDTSFGDGGLATYQHGGTIRYGHFLDEEVGQAKALAIDSQGRILVGGGSGAAMLLLRYLPSGVLDPSFGVGGVLRFFEYQTTGPDFADPDVYAPRVKAIAPRPDGSLVVVAQTNPVGYAAGSQRDLIFWITASGELDTSNGVPFSERVGTMSFSMPRSAAVDADGNIFIAGAVVVGTDYYGSPTRYAGYVMKRDPLGEWFEPFGGNYAPGGEPWQGIRTLTPVGRPPYSAYTGLKLLSGGKILTGGHHNNRLLVSRLTARGKLDRSFGPWRGKKRRHNKGATIVNFGGKKCRCTNNGDITTDRRGRIYQVGVSTHPYKNRIATIVVVRYRHNGSVDRTFGRNGIVKAIRKPWTRATSIAIQKNGRIVVSARYGYDDTPKFMVARFMPDGKLDRSFFKRGFYVDHLGDASAAEKVIVDHRGRIVVAGGYAQSDTGNFVVERLIP